MTDVHDDGDLSENVLIIEKIVSKICFKYEVHYRIAYSRAVPLSEFLARFSRDFNNRSEIATVALDPAEDRIIHTVPSSQQENYGGRSNVQQTTTDTCSI